MGIKETGWLWGIPFVSHILFRELCQNANLICSHLFSRICTIAFYIHFFYDWLNVLTQNYSNIISRFVLKPFLFLMLNKLLQSKQQEGQSQFFKPAATQEMWLYIKEKKNNANNVLQPTSLGSEQHCILSPLSWKTQYFKTFSVDMLKQIELSTFLLLLGWRY